MPRTIVAANWKMHKTCAQTRAFFDAFLPRLDALPQSVEIVVAPPYTSLGAAADAIAAHPRVLLGAQNMHWEPQGAYTGEISASMLVEQRVSHAIIGHSERRAACGERDDTVNLKLLAALAAGLTPIVAVGETLDERDAGLTDERVTAQTRAALEAVPHADLARIVLAYEPIWAIGTGKNCDPAEANRVMGAIRACARLRDVPILYGGSMKAANVASYMAQPNVNGGLVGGASLDPSEFASLIEGAA